MKSPLIRICNIADSVLKNMGYDSERLGYSQDEINEMRKFIEFAKKTNLHIVDMDEIGKQLVNTDENGNDWVLR